MEFLGSGIRSLFGIRLHSYRPLLGPAGNRSGGANGTQSTMQPKATDTALDVGPDPLVADEWCTFNVRPMCDAPIQDPATKPAMIVGALECAFRDPERIEARVDFVRRAGFFVFGRGCRRIMRA